MKKEVIEERELPVNSPSNGKSELKEVNEVLLSKLKVINANISHYLDIMEYRLGLKLGSNLREFWEDETRKAKVKDDSEVVSVDDIKKDFTEVIAELRAKDLEDMKEILQIVEIQLSYTIEVEYKEVVTVLQSSTHEESCEFFLLENLRYIYFFGFRPVIYSLYFIEQYLNNKNKLNGINDSLSQEKNRLIRKANKNRRNLNEQLRLIESRPVSVGTTVSFEGILEALQTVKSSLIKDSQSVEKEIKEIQDELKKDEVNEDEKKQLQKALDGLEKERETLEEESRLTVSSTHLMKGSSRSSASAPPPTTLTEQDLDSITNFLSSRVGSETEKECSESHYSPLGKNPTPDKANKKNDSLLLNILERAEKSNLFRLILGSVLVLPAIVLIVSFKGRQAEKALSALGLALPEFQGTLNFSVAKAAEGIFTATNTVIRKIEVVLSSIA